MIRILLLTLMFCWNTLPSTLFCQKIEFSQKIFDGLETNLQSDLMPALDSLINQIRKNNLSNILLFDKNSAITQEVWKGIYNLEKSSIDSSLRKSVNLLNCFPIDQNQYMCQLAYFTSDERDLKALQLILNLVAIYEKDRVTFSLPLDYYTNTWKEQQVGDITYLFRDTMSLDRAELFALKNTQFAKRFKQPVRSLRFYLVENYQEISKLLGFEYNASTVGILRDGYGVIGNQVIFAVANNEDFSHDLFHFYSETIHERSVRNWVTEEGLAYSWGNAYYAKKDGEMADQAELVSILRAYMNENPDVDLLHLFRDNFWSDKSGIYDHLAPDFIVGRVISSVLCDEVYKKHAMQGLNYLLTIGSKPDHFAPFFSAIDSLLGIDEENFDSETRLLVQNFR